MKTIHKYEIDLYEYTCVKLPLEYKILAFKKQGDGIFIWVEVDDMKNPSIDIKFRLIGTGHEVPKNCEYIGTVVTHAFVWHLYNEQ